MYSEWCSELRGSGVCVCARVHVCVCMSLSAMSWIQDEVKDITVPTCRACLHVASYSWSFSAVCCTYVTFPHNVCVV